MGTLVSFIASKAPKSDGILKKYAALIEKSDADYDRQITALDKPYYDAKTAAASGTRLAIKNANEKYAADGLSRSGESAQNALIGNALLATEQSELAKGYISDKSRLQAEKIAARNSLAAQAEEETAKRDEDYLQTMIKGIERDREHGIDLKKLRDSEQNDERDYETAKQKLALEKEKLALDSEKALRDYEIKLRTIALTEDENSFENEIARAYLELERNKAYSK